jgi:hypothetical protein
MIAHVLLPRALPKAPVAPGFVYVLLWTAVLVVGPFYLLPSGLPQPADFAMAGLMLVVVLSHGFRLRPSLAGLAFLLGLFVLDVVLVNSSWAVITGRPSLLINSMYYLFNALVFVTFLVLYSHTGSSILRLTLWAVSASVILQAALSVFQGTTELRQALFFNNPNQLGYYSLLSIALFAYGTRYLRVHPAYEAVFYLCALWLASLALSKAALLATAVLVPVLLVRRPLLTVAIALPITANLLFASPGQEWQNNLQRRFESFGLQADDSIAGRGYDRILHHPELLLLGAGEGAFDRFVSALDGSEMHSTWGSILFSYGLLGSLLFLLFAGTLFALAGPGSVPYFLPVFLYGLAHNGVRFTLLWVLLAFVACVSLASRSNMEAAEQ